MIKFVFENDHFNISFGENYKGDWEQACLLTQLLNCEQCQFANEPLLFTQIA